MEFWNGKATTVEYDKSSRKTKETLRNGVESTFSYNAIGKLLNVTHQKGGTILTTRNYEYDLAGNRASMTDESGRQTLYQYDPLNQLTRVDYPDGTSVSYTYDTVGNRLSLTIHGLLPLQATMSLEDLIQGMVSYQDPQAIKWSRQQREIAIKK